MNKETLIKLTAVAMSIMLALSLVNTYRINSELSRIRQQLSNMEHNIISGVNQQNASVLHQTRQDIRQLLQEEQSLFTGTSVDVELIDGQLAVTMSALPKEISHDERLYASVFANGNTYEQEIDASNQAVLLMDITRTISPAFIIRSDQGIRQEKLSDINIRDRLSFYVYSEWDEAISRIDDQAVLNLWLVDAEEGAPLSEADIEKAEFILINLDLLYDTGQSDEPFYMEYGFSDIIIDFIDQDDSDVIIRVPAEMVRSNNMTYGSKDRFHFQTDLSSVIAQHENSNFDIHFLLSTSQGIRYVNTLNSIASIHMFGNNLQAGSGSERLVPILDQQ